MKLVDIGKLQVQREYIDSVFYKIDKVILCSAKILESLHSYEYRNDYDFAAIILEHV